MKIPKELDRRIKLSDDDKAKIKKLYGKISQRKLAKAFGVSRRLIQFIGDEEKHKRNLLQRKLTGGSSQYYKKDRHKKYMKKHRRYKRGLELKGELKLQKKK